MRISDWSSDVCSSDLMDRAHTGQRQIQDQPVNTVVELAGNDAGTRLRQCLRQRLGPVTDLDGTVAVDTVNDHDPIIRTCGQGGGNLACVRAHQLPAQARLNGTKWEPASASGVLMARCRNR